MLTELTGASEVGWYVVSILFLLVLWNGVLDFSAAMFSKVTTATIFARRLQEEPKLERQNSQSGGVVFPPKKRDANIEAAFDRRKNAVRKAMDYLTEREREETGGEWDVARRKLEADRARDYLAEKEWEREQEELQKERDMEKDLLYQKQQLENERLEKEQAAAAKRERQRQQELELQKQREYLMHARNYDDTGLLWPPQIPIKMRHPSGSTSREESMEYYSSDSDDEGKGAKGQHSTESASEEEPVIMGHLQRAMLRAEERAAERLTGRPEGPRPWKSPETTAEIHHYGVRTLPLSSIGTATTTTNPQGSTSGQSSSYDQLTTPEGQSGDELSSNDEGRKVHFGKKSNGQGIKSSRKASGASGSSDNSGSTDGILKNNGKTDSPGAAHGGARPKTKLCGANVDEKYNKKKTQSTKSHKLSPRLDHKEQSPQASPDFRTEKEKKTDKTFSFTLGQSDIERGYLHHMGLDVLAVDPDDSTRWKEKIERHEKRTSQKYPSSPSEKYPLPAERENITVEVHETDPSEEIKSKNVNSKPAPASPRNIIEIPGNLDGQLEELTKQFRAGRTKSTDQPPEDLEGGDESAMDDKGLSDGQKGLSRDSSLRGSGRRHALKSPKSTRQGPILVPPSVMKEAIKSHGTIGVLTPRVGIPEEDAGKPEPGSVLLKQSSIAEGNPGPGADRRSSVKSSRKHSTDSERRESSSRSRNPSGSSELERRGSSKSRDGRSPGRQSARDADRRGSTSSRSSGKLTRGDSERRRHEDNPERKGHTDNPGGRGHTDNPGGKGHTDNPGHGDSSSRSHGSSHERRSSERDSSRRHSESGSRRDSRSRRDSETSLNSRRPGIPPELKGDQKTALEEDKGSGKVRTPDVNRYLQGDKKYDKGQKSPNPGREHDKGQKSPNPGRKKGASSKSDSGLAPPVAPVRRNRSTSRQRYLERTPEMSEEGENPTTSGSPTKQYKTGLAGSKSVENNMNKSAGKEVSWAKEIERGREEKRVEAPQRPKRRRDESRSVERGEARSSTERGREGGTRLSEMGTSKSEGSIKSLAKPEPIREGIALDKDNPFPKPPARRSRGASSDAKQRTPRESKESTGESTAESRVKEQEPLSPEAENTWNIPTRPERRARRSDRKLHKSESKSQSSTESKGTDDVSGIQTKKTESFESVELKLRLDEDEKEKKTETERKDEKKDSSQKDTRSSIYEKRADFLSEDKSSPRESEWKKGHLTSKDKDKSSPKESKRSKGSTSETKEEKDKSSPRESKRRKGSTSSKTEDVSSEEKDKSSPKEGKRTKSSPPKTSEDPAPAEESEAVPKEESKRRKSSSSENKVDVEGEPSLQTTRSERDSKRSSSEAHVPTEEKEGDNGVVADKDKRTSKSPSPEAEQLEDGDKKGKESPKMKRSKSMGKSPSPETEKREDGDKKGKESPKMKRSKSMSKSPSPETETSDEKEKSSPDTRRSKGEETTESEDQHSESKDKLDPEVSEDPSKDQLRKEPSIEADTPRDKSPSPPDQLTLTPTMEEEEGVKGTVLSSPDTGPSSIEPDFPERPPRKTKMKKKKADEEKPDQDDLPPIRPARRTSREKGVRSPEVKQRGRTEESVPPVRTPTSPLSPERSPSFRGAEGKPPPSPSVKSPTSPVAPERSSRRREGRPKTEKASHSIRSPTSPLSPERSPSWKSPVGKTSSLTRQTSPSVRSPTSTLSPHRSPSLRSLGAKPVKREGSTQSLRTPTSPLSPDRSPLTSVKLQVTKFLKPASQMLKPATQMFKKDRTSTKHDIDFKKALASAQKVILCTSVDVASSTSADRAPYSPTRKRASQDGEELVYSHTGLKEMQPVIRTVIIDAETQTEDFVTLTAESPSVTVSPDHSLLPSDHVPQPLDHSPLPSDDALLPADHSPLLTVHSPLPSDHSPVPTDHSPLQFDPSLLSPVKPTSAEHLSVTSHSSKDSWAFASGADIKEVSLMIDEISQKTVTLMKPSGSPKVLSNDVIKQRSPRELRQRSLSPMKMLSPTDSVRQTDTEKKSWTLPRASAELARDTRVLTSPVTSAVVSTATGPHITSPVTSAVVSTATAPHITSPVTSAVTSTVTSPLTSYVVPTETRSLVTSPVISPVRSHAPVSPVTADLTSTSTSRVTSPMTSPVTSQTTISPVTVSDVGASPLTSPVSSTFTSPEHRPELKPRRKHEAKLANLQIHTADSSIPLIDQDVDEDISGNDQIEKVDEKSPASDVHVILRPGDSKSSLRERRDRAIPQNQPLADRFSTLKAGEDIDLKVTEEKRPLALAGSSPQHKAQISSISFSKYPAGADRRVSPGQSPQFERLREITVPDRPQVLHSYEDTKGDTVESVKKDAPAKSEDSLVDRSDSLTSSVGSSVSFAPMDTVWSPGETKSAIKPPYTLWGEDGWVRTSPERLTEHHPHFPNHAPPIGDIGESRRGSTKSDSTLETDRRKHDFRLESDSGAKSDSELLESTDKEDADTFVKMESESVMKSMATPAQITLESTSTDQQLPIEEKHVDLDIEGPETQDQKMTDVEPEIDRYLEKVEDISRKLSDTVVVDLVAKCEVESDDTFEIPETEEHVPTDEPSSLSEKVPLSEVIPLCEETSSTPETTHPEEKVSRTEQETDEMASLLKRIGEEKVAAAEQVCLTSTALGEEKAPIALAESNGETEIGIGMPAEQLDQPEKVPKEEFVEATTKEEVESPSCTQEEEFPSREAEKVEFTPVEMSDRIPAEEKLEFDIQEASWKEEENLKATLVESSCPLGTTPIDKAEETIQTPSSFEKDHIEEKDLSLFTGETGFGDETLPLTIQTESETIVDEPVVGDASKLGHTDEKEPAADVSTVDSQTVEEKEKATPDDHIADTQTTSETNVSGVEIATSEAIKTEETGHPEELMTMSTEAESMAEELQTSEAMHEPSLEETASSAETESQEVLLDTKVISESEAKAPTDTLDSSMITYSSDVDATQAQGETETAEERLSSEIAPEMEQTSSYSEPAPQEKESFDEIPLLPCDSKGEQLSETPLKEGETQEETTLTPFESEPEQLSETTLKEGETQEETTLKPSESDPEQLSESTLQEKEIPKEDIGMSCDYPNNCDLEPDQPGVTPLEETDSQEVTIASEGTSILHQEPDVSDHEKQQTELELDDDVFLPEEAYLDKEKAATVDSSIKDKAILKDESVEDCGDNVKAEAPCEDRDMGPEGDGGVAVGIEQIQSAYESVQSEHVEESTKPQIDIKELLERDQPSDADLDTQKETESIIEKSDEAETELAGTESDVVDKTEQVESITPEDYSRETQGGRLGTETVEVEYTQSDISVAGSTADPQNISESISGVDKVPDPTLEGIESVAAQEVEITSIESGSESCAEPKVLVESPDKPEHEGISETDENKLSTMHEAHLSTETEDFSAAAKEGQVPHSEVAEHDQNVLKETVCDKKSEDLHGESIESEADVEDDTMSRSESQISQCTVVSVESKAGSGSEASGSGIIDKPKTEEDMAREVAEYITKAVIKDLSQSVAEGSMQSGKDDSEKLTVDDNTAETVIEDSMKAATEETDIADSMNTVTEETVIDDLMKTVIEKSDSSVNNVVPHVVPETQDGDYPVDMEGSSSSSTSVETVIDQASKRDPDDDCSGGKRKSSTDD